jgi:hypothetical protein
VAQVTECLPSMCEALSSGPQNRQEKIQVKGKLQLQKIY